MVTLAIAIHVNSLPALGVAVLLAAGVAVLAARRHLALPRLSLGLAGIGVGLLALAAGGWLWDRPAPQEALVMVDLSPSTRTATYRDRQVLDKRIAQLLGSTPHRIIYFSDATHQTIAPGRELSDLPSEKTVYAPPPASAIVLFSDCRFPLPASSPPTFIAADAMLEEPDDGAVERLEVRNQIVVATIRNHGTRQRQLTMEGQKQEIGSGQFVVSRPLSAASPTATAQLAGGDPWPENDQLAIKTLPPALSQRWWIGADAPANWKSLSPEALPNDPSPYLEPSVIVLKDVPASALSEAQQKLLRQYVRDLGGSLVLIGGPHAFAAGGYPGTPLETLSPLASSPPKPTIHWILLADSSGSMAAAEAGQTRWDLARQALLRLIPRLPPQDPVTIGNFAQRLNWWSQGKSARETATLPMPQVTPNGPTNLEPVLTEIISRTDAATDKELLVVSDADTDITRPDELLAGLKARKLHLSLLVIGKGGRGVDLLSSLSRNSGGQVLVELSPDKWSTAAANLLAMTMPQRLHRDAVSVRYQGDLARLGSTSAPLWNRTWIKPEATALAQASTTEGPLAMVGRWNVGAGQVLAVSFEAPAADAQAMALSIEQPPRDPRFVVRWDLGPDITVNVDASDSGAYLNHQPLELQWPGGRAPIPQTAPGRYHISVDAPREGGFATLWLGQRVIDRVAVAGRYAREFSAIGNDRHAMAELAQRTGGAVIAPYDTRRIDFGWPARRINITSWLAALGAALVAAGLVWWRLQ